MRKDPRYSPNSGNIIWDALIARARARIRRGTRHAAHLRALVRVFESKRDATAGASKSGRRALSRRLRSA
jgi:hypothetical protein